MGHKKISLTACIFAGLIPGAIAGYVFGESSAPLIVASIIGAAGRRARLRALSPEE